MMEENLRKLQAPQIEKAKAYLETRKKWLGISTNIDAERILIKSLIDVWEDMTDYLLIIWETSRKYKLNNPQ